MYIILDIGGAKIRVSRIDDLVNPKILNSKIIFAENYYEDDLTELIKATYEVSVGKDEIEGIAIGTAGVVDAANKMLVQSRKLNSWAKKPLAEDLELEFNVPVYIENNAVTAALAEMQYGVAQKENFTFILWQDGIGATNLQIINNYIIITPMEVGHHIIDWKGVPCECGQRGCFQLYCSEAGAKTIYAKTMNELNESEWKQVTEKMAWGIINLLCMKRTRLIVFSGITGVTREDKVLEIFREVQNNLKVLDVPEFRISSLGDDAVTLGGAALILNHKNYFI
jgi:predicted NBD/HSP70 family sugar kinase